MKLQPIKNEKFSSLFSGPEKDFKDHIPETKGKKPRKEAKKHYTPDAETQKAQKMDNNSALNSRGDKFLSAGEGNINNQGGSSNYIGKGTNNSIWDNGVLDRLAQSQSNHEKTKEEKSDTEKTRNGFKQERLDAMVSSLQNADTRKANTIGDLTSSDGSSGRQNYRLPTNNISMFDSGDFDRVPEKSVGDEIREAARTPKEKDNSWREMKPTQKLNEKISKLFD